MHRAAHPFQLHCGGFVGWVAALCAQLAGPTFSHSLHCRDYPAPPHAPFLVLVLLQPQGPSCLPACDPLPATAMHLVPSTRIPCHTCLLAFLVFCCCLRGLSAARKPPPTTTRPLDIVFVSAEVAPWSKTGGLGDVMGALPQAMADRGHTVMVVSPR